MMTVCVKCKKVDPVPCIDIKFALYCSPCFLEATYHKYRILLSRSRSNIPLTTPTTSLVLLPRNFLQSPQVLRACKVLIRFALLPAVQEPARKNLVTYDLGVPESKGIKEFIEDIRMEYQQSAYLRDIYILKSTGEAVKHEDYTESDNSDNTLELSNTLKEDLLNAKLLHDQLKLMSSLQVDKAMIPDTSTALASYIITCTCKGRGQFLPWDSALVRYYPNNLALCRPLKDISDREIELYCQETSLSSSAVIQRANPLVSSLSIDQLTLNFLTNLETENPGTANVVIRTCSKVSTSCDQESDARCPICLAPNTSGVVCDSCAPIKEYFQ